LGTWFGDGLLVEVFILKSCWVESYSENESITFTNFLASHDEDVETAMKEFDLELMFQEKCFLFDDKTQRKESSHQLNYP